mgnify:CR=1 FL=1
MSDYLLACHENLPSQKAFYREMGDDALARTAGFYADQVRTALGYDQRRPERTFYSLILPELLRRLAPDDAGVARAAEMLAGEDLSLNQQAFEFIQVPARSRPLPLMLMPSPSIPGLAPSVLNPDVFSMAEPGSMKRITDYELMMMAEFHYPGCDDEPGSTTFGAALVHVMLPEILRRLRIRE